MGSGCVGSAAVCSELWLLKVPGGTVAARVSFQRERGVKARAGTGCAGLEKSRDSARSAYLPKKIADHAKKKGKAPHVPMNPTLKLSKTDEKDIITSDEFDYPSAVGGILFLALTARLTSPNAPEC